MSVGSVQSYKDNVSEITYEKLTTTQQMAILKQQLKIKTEYQRMFRKYFHIDYVKYFSKYKPSESQINTIFDIYTTRYTSDTFLQNKRFKNNINWDGAFYSTTLQFPKNTPDKLLFILDMNNTTNKILGVGLLRNKLCKEQHYNVYTNQTFNNFIYKSSFYIPLINSEDCNQYYSNINVEWIKFIEEEFEARLFYGKSHSKRGGSFMRFPIKHKHDKHLLFLISLFVILNPNDFVQKVLGKISV